MAAAANGHFGAVQLLRASGADCNAANDYDDTVLVKAAGNGNMRVIEALLSAGADPAQRGELQRLPYEEAEHCGHPAAAELLRTAFAARP